MKKGLVKVLIPMTALLLSSCSFLDFLKPNKNQDSIPVEPDNQDDDHSGEVEEETPVTPPQEVYPDSIELQESLPLEVGKTKTLTAKLSPSNITYDTVVWTSSNTTVATVENGAVTGVSFGSTVIKAKTRNQEGKEISSSCKVVVSNADVLKKTKFAYTYDDYSTNNAYQLDSCPLVGEPKLLVVPIWFNDSAEFIAEENRELVRDDIRTAYFGTNEESGWRSVKTFYEEESYNIMSLTGTVAEWYEIGESYNAYKPGSASGKTMDLVEQATDWYFKNNASDPRISYDTNSDGYLDGVMLIYAAPDMRSSGIPDSGNLWAYTYWLQQGPSTRNPQPNAFFWSSYDFMYSWGDDALSRTGKTSFGCGDTRNCNVDSHTFIHEMGHVLGAPDYYDYSGQHEPAGGFSMQDENVGGHDPYSVIAFGWAEPYIPTASMTITINDFQKSHDLILLANHDVDSPFDEYMLLEFYSPTGLNELDSQTSYSERYPKGPNEVGIRLWHVDARLTYYVYNWSTTLVTHPSVGQVHHAMTNTYYLANSSSNSSISPLGVSYADFNILQLIHNEGNQEQICENSLFKLGSTFKVSDYSSQFVKSQKMNDGKTLGWSFSVEAIDETSASIKLNKI